MSKQEGVASVLGMFDRLTSADPGLVSDFTDAVDETLADARLRLEAMTDTLAYIENPEHPMAGSLHFCAIMLAVYLALRERGMDVHDFGAAMMAMVAAGNKKNPAPAVTEPAQALVESAALPVNAGEFEYEVYNDEGNRYRLNIKSCAICGLFSQYDMMELVPYMCASDDVVSDAAGQGLQRTGTIALGAHQCDFVFDKGGESRRLVDQYPEKIRLLP